MSKGIRYTDEFKQDAVADNWTDSGDAGKTPCQRRILDKALNFYVNRRGCMADGFMHCDQ